MNAGYSKEIEKQFIQNLDIEIHLFTDDKSMKSKNTRFHYHEMDDNLFLSYLSKSKGYITTAGFESICEALYLGKPVLLKPVKNHYEQECNANDALKANAGIISYNFNFSDLKEYISTYKFNENFKKWTESTYNKLLSILT